MKTLFEIKRLAYIPNGIKIYAKQPQGRTGIATTNGPVGVGVIPEFVWEFTGTLGVEWIDKIAVGNCIAIELGDQ